MIRPAIKTDLSKIIQITQACAKHLCEMGIFQWNENYPSLEAFEKDLSDEELFVLEIESKVIGAIVISTRKDDVYKPKPRLAGTAASFGCIAGFGCDCCLLHRSQPAWYRIAQLWLVL